MSVNSIPHKIALFNVYNRGNKQVGVSGEVKLPDFESLTEDMETAGMLGKVSSPTPGLFDSMEIEIPFYQLWDEAFMLMNPLERQQITLRGSVQIQDAGMGKIVNKGMRVVVEGYPKGLVTGAWKAGSPTNSSVKLEVEYIKITIEGKTMLELDKFNVVYILNGIDIIEKVREQI